MYRTFVSAFVAFCLFACASTAFAQRSGDVRVEADVPYKADAATEYERERCRLDLYLPAEGAKDFPTIVWFHGGWLVGGDKGNPVASGAAKGFPRDGIAFASVNYRLSPDAKFPAYVEDAAAAVAFVRRTIAERGGDPQRVFVSGHSAGGYLAAMLAMDRKYLAKHDLNPDDLAGYLPIAGQMIVHSTVRVERGVPEYRPVVDEAAPAFHARKDAPRILCIAGGQDLPARAEENRWFVAAMKHAGHELSEYAEFEGRDHGTIASRLGEPGDAVAAKMKAFMGIEKPGAEPVGR